MIAIKFLPMFFYDKNQIILSVCLKNLNFDPYYTRIILDVFTKHKNKK